VDAADVFLLLLDILLLRLVGLELLLVALLAQPPVLLVVAGVDRDLAVVQLKNLGDGLVQKIAVVADDEHGLRLLDQILLQPLGGVDVEVVARLIEQHDIGTRQEQFGQEQAALLPAAEGAALAVKVGAGKAQPLQHRADAVVDGVGPVVRQQLVEPVVAGAEGFAFALALRLRQRLGGVDEFFLGVEEFAEGRLGLLVERAPRGELGVLLQQADPCPGV
jgi:chaperonin GroEL (HSP60 family)